MSDATGIDALVDALIEARPAVEALGASAVEAAYKVLLFELAREMARRERDTPSREP